MVNFRCFMAYFIVAYYINKTIALIVMMNLMDKEII